MIMVTDKLILLLLLLLLLLLRSMPGQRARLCQSETQVSKSQENAEFTVRVTRHFV